VGAQRRDFCACKRTPGAQCQIAQRQITLAHPNQPQHGIPQRARHFTDLALASLAQHNPRPGTFISRLDQIDPGWCSWRTIEPHAGTPLPQRLSIQRAIQQHPILFFYFKAWMGKMVRELAIVGEQNQPFTINIQPSNRKHPRWHIHQIKHFGAPLRIIYRRNKASRFMQ
jgi:hypothetical protein